MDWIWLLKLRLKTKNLSFMEKVNVKTWWIAAILIAAISLTGCENTGDNDTSGKLKFR